MSAIEKAVERLVSLGMVRKSDGVDALVEVRRVLSEAVPEAVRGETPMCGLRRSGYNQCRKDLGLDE